jgi:hypothetical protein
MQPYKRWISKFEIKPGSWVFVPSLESIASGKRIKTAIESLWTPPTNYYHLRNGGHVAAIKLHCQNNCFIHLDIKDFFGSINKSRVTRCLKKYFGYADARCMARESTVNHPKILQKVILPFGFVQSPIIASLCLHESFLGNTLDKLTNAPDVNVSIYMDDIIISSKNESQSVDILKKIKKAADKSFFVLNAKKEEGPAEQITSFNINLSHDNTEIDAIRFSQFYNDFHDPDANKIQRDGYKNYIKSVNPNQSTLLL